MFQFNLFNIKFSDVDKHQKPLHKIFGFKRYLKKRILIDKNKDVHAFDISRALCPDKRCKSKFYCPYILKSIIVAAVYKVIFKKCFVKNRRSKSCLLYTEPILWINCCVVTCTENGKQYVPFLILALLCPVVF